MKKIFLFLLAVMPTIAVFSQGLSLDDIDETVVATTNPTSIQQPVAPMTQTQVAKTVDPVPQAVELYQYSWAELGSSTRSAINEMARKYPFGTTQMVDITNVKSVTTITGLKSRSGRTMTQYVIVYLDSEGVEHGILTYDNPLVSQECPECYIKCVATSPGFHQGDDEDIPHQAPYGENHKIPQGW